MNPPPTPRKCIALNLQLFQAQSCKFAKLLIHMEAWAANQMFAHMIHPAFLMARVLWNTQTPLCLHVCVCLWVCVSVNVCVWECVRCLNIHSHTHPVTRGQKWIKWWVRWRPFQVSPCSLSLYAHNLFDLLIFLSSSHFFFFFFLFFYWANG